MRGQNQQSQGLLLQARQGKVKKRTAKPGDPDFVGPLRGGEAPQKPGQPFFIGPTTAFDQAETSFKWAKPSIAVSSLGGRAETTPITTTLTPKETVKGVAEGAKAIGTLTREALVRFPARVALDIMNIDRVQKGQDIITAFKPVDPSAGKVEQTLAKTFFGEEPLHPLAVEIAERELAGQSKGRAFATVIGLAALDFTGLGGPAKVKNLLKAAKTVEEAAAILRKAKVAEDLIEAYAPVFAKAKTVKEVEAGISALEKVSQTTFLERLSQTTKKGRGIEVIPETIKLHPEDVKRMEEFIDYTRFGKKGAENIQLEVDARRIAEHYGMNPEQANAKLANAFDARLTKLRQEGQIPKATPTVPKLKTEITNTVADEAIKFAKANPESSLVAKEFRDPVTKELIGGPRLFRRIGEGIRTGEISINSLPEIVQKYGLNAEQTANLFEDAATYSGRTLQALSRVEKELRALLPDIIIPKREMTLWERFKSRYIAIDNTRRGLLVTQLSTAARNAISQAGRYSLGTMTDAMNGVLSKIAGKGPGFTPFFEDIAAVMRKLTPGNTKRLQKIMQDFPIENARLYNTPVSDVALSNKITNTLNTFNRAQEYFFRNLILDAKLSSASKIAKVPIEKLPLDAFTKAVDEALEWTFAKSPARGSFGSAIMTAYQAMPPLTLINPFPRFMANAVKFLYEFSPLGVMSLLRPSTRAAIAAGDYTSISKAIIGTSMLGAATVIRSNPNLAGEKWYEIKVGDKTWDTRAFAPFSTYLLFADLMVHGTERMTGGDWAQATIGINRVAGTGLALVDLIDQKVDYKNVKQIVGNLVSTYVGGFTVPFRTISDVIGQFRLEERTVKEARELPIIGHAVANIPGLQEILSTKYSLFEDRPLQREQTLLRQATGITLTTKPFILKELDRMGKSVGDLIPKTGNLEANRIISKQTGIILDEFNNVLEISKKYQEMSDGQKLEFVKTLVSEAKKEAKGQIASDLALVVYKELKKTKKEKRSEVLQNLSNRGLLTDNILDYLLPMIEAQPLP